MKLTVPQAAAQQKLLCQLEQLKAAAGASAGGAGGAGGRGGAGGAGGAVGEGNTASYSLSVRAVGRGGAGESLLAGTVLYTVNILFSVNVKYYTHFNVQYNIQCTIYINNGNAHQEEETGNSNNNPLQY